MATTWTPEEALAKIRAGAMRGVMAGTELVHTVATQKIQNPPKTGRVYRRRGISHRASAPGEAPATDTGGLVQSGSTSYDLEQVVGRVNWSAAHAPAMEYGTQRIEPRPFARVSLEESREEITSGIAEAVKAELGG